MRRNKSPCLVLNAVHELQEIEYIKKTRKNYQTVHKIFFL